MSGPGLGSGKAVLPSPSGQRHAKINHGNSFSFLSPPISPPPLGEQVVDQPMSRPEATPPFTHLLCKPTSPGATLAGRQLPGETVALQKASPFANLQSGLGDGGLSKSMSLLSLSRSLSF